MKKVFIGLLIVFVGFFIWLAIAVFPAISGYGTKNMCSAIYLQHRDMADVSREDLADFPKSLGNYSWDQQDSSVTGTVLGLAKKKAIYRNGCGCTLVNDFSEAEIRRQVFRLPAKPGNRDSILWPAGDKLSDSFPANINRAKLESAVNSALNEKTASGEPAYTRAVLVVYKGQIVAEKYAEGFDKNTVMLGWSVSKSLIGTMIGVLVQKHRLSVEDPAPVAEWANTDRAGIRIKNLLQQNSGLDFTEIYSRPSSVTKMLFSKGDMAAYTASLPLKYAPGTVFNYSSGNSNILSRIIRIKVGEQDYAGFPYTELFHKINAYSFLLEPDASGTYVGSSYSYANARDFARFGLLYYNNGMWNGEQLLPADWVKQATAPALAGTLKNYGYQFWLNGLDANDPSKRKYPDVPAEMFYANGYGGQGIYVIPSADLVVVRLGLQMIDVNRFLKEVVGAVRSN